MIPLGDSSNRPWARIGWAGPKIDSARRVAKGRPSSVAFMEQAARLQPIEGVKAGPNGKDQQANSAGQGQGRGHSTRG